MRHEFIKTDNYIRCLEALKELEALPRDMEKMGLLFGNAGRGKSLIIERLAAELDAALVRTLGGWTAKSMLIDICFELGLDDKGSTATLQNRVIDELTEHPRILIIDEIDTLFENNKRILLVMLRDIHDVAKTPIVFTGMEQCEKKFKKDAHYYDRFARKIKMIPTTLNDIRRLCDSSTIKIENDLVEYLHNKYRNFRPIKVLITALENYCELNDYDSVDLKTFKASEVEKINEH